jgi:HEAT repeat
MANNIHEILSSKMKHKEQVAAMAEMTINDDRALVELIGILRTGTDVEKGTVAEVLKFVAKDNPEMVVPYIDVLIENIDYKAPRVRWGCPESIGYLAPKYPGQVEKAIPKLLENLNDRSTVVRWCAAFALTEISKYNLDKQKELVGEFPKLVNTEQNNGVRNVYLKALKVIGRQQRV